MVAEIRRLDCEPLSKGIAQIIDELAKRNAVGELSAIAVAIVDRDGVADYINSYCPSYSTMLGAIERLKFRITYDAEFGD